MSAWQWILLLTAIPVVGWFALGIWALIKAPLMEEDVPVRPAGSPGLRPEEAERPAIPRQIVVHLSVSDRIERNPLTAWERAHAREMWEAFVAEQDAKRRTDA